MASIEFQENSVGTPLIFQVLNNAGDGPLNISGYTTRRLIFTRSDGTKVIKDGTLYTDGTDGLLMFTTGVGDFTPPGWYQIQAQLLAPSVEQYAEADVFYVNPNL